MPQANNAILLVEDNPDDVDLTLRAFKKNNILNPVTVARDGEEALNLLLGTGTGPGPGPVPLPQVVLLDLKLPKIDGLEVLRRIRAHPRTRLLPVVMMTSSREERDIIESYANGANSYMQKPVAFAEFVEAVKHIGLYWLILNVPPPVQNG